MRIEALAGPWLGRLSLSALPTDSPVAMGAALVAVFGALGVAGYITGKGKWRYLWREWFTSVDHKRIGIMYVVLALVMLARAVIEALVMRLQQADAVNRSGFISAEHFGQLFSTHGSIMIFFMAMPFLTGVINYVMPLQIGARDVSFPVLNSISLMLTAAGAALVMISLVLAPFSTGGWSGYAPFTELRFSPGVGVDYWIWAVTLSSIGSTLTGINFAVTIYKKRAPGMHLFRMPLFCWTALCTSILMIFAMPALTVATALLALDRYLGMHFFTSGGGGNMMVYANLFWLFGHPEVYIVVLPSFGVFSELFSTFSAKKLYGYTSLVLATMTIAVLSFTVWLHHFFTMGQSAHINAAFGIATMLIGIPTGVKVYDWILTMFRGRVRFTTPLLWGLAFLVTFVIGGLSGILLAIPPVDFLVHNTTFLVAHFHNMLIPGTLFGMIAAYQFWFPKAFGFRLEERWGRVAFGCWVIGFYLAFMPLYVLGLEGMPRRSAEVFDEAFRPWLLVAAGGAVLIVLGMAALALQLAMSIRHRDRNRVRAGDPWDGRSLEWSTSSPPPEYNFAKLPEVQGRDAFWTMKRSGRAYPPLERYAPIMLPENSAIGPLLGALGLATAFGLVWRIGWMAGLGTAGALVAVIGWSFVRRPGRTVDERQVERTETRWHAVLVAAVPVSREHECDPRNRGLADVAA
ncbi:cbb3-type cytochrome c oxidase subunit I [Dyella lutea]|uniref:Cbb3-type cytochrome c oxidase subunit I n=1 Tax=Dyella lutea TaxID=2950441 RepID=A0ABT1FHE2_9GAMM|nr:cbb3-type cytochrome c oxidase subunit I [Dyella lutea]MCP1375853.1 cbb3-type cytochrome c oxidase subunit I [Dyella lutea]